MTPLIFATHNRNKVEEIRSIMPERQVLSLSDIEYQLEIPETGSTLFENALIKVKTLYKATGRPCIADDTGLEVKALFGAPGVYSARYAGMEADSQKNIDKLLSEMDEMENREAVFRTVLAYMNENGQYRFFEGEVRGQIAHEPKGNGGFGYDPVFIPEGQSRSFAEMSLAEKNQISHRRRALADFETFFRSVAV